MLAVVGSPWFQPGLVPGSSGDAGGLAAAIARVAAAQGAGVQLIGKVGDDPSGDAVLLALARDGVGHLALQRDAGHATPIASPFVAAVDPADTEPIAALLASDSAVTPGAPDDRAAPGPPVGLAMEPADISLGLRYLRDFRVVVAADPLDEPASLVIADAASFADAVLIIIAPHERAAPNAPAAAIVLEAPEIDPDGAFAALVGRFAAALDRGEDAGSAFRTAAAHGGWERAAG